MDVQYQQENEESKALVVTPAMIEAGMGPFMRYQEGYDDPELVLSRVFRSMHAAQTK